MPGELSDQIKAILVNERVAGTTFGSLYLALLTGSIPTIDHATVYSDLSPYLASWAGYSAQAIGSWGGAALTGAYHARATAANCTFGNSSGSASPSVTGWMMYSTAGGTNRLVCADAYPTPFVIPNGGSYVTAPTWQDTGE